MARTRHYHVSCLLIAGILILNPDNTLASCGSANCFLVTGTQEGVFEPGQVVVDLSYRYIPQDRKKRGRSGTNEVLVPKIDFENGEIIPDHHRELRTINMLSQFNVNIGLSPKYTVALAVPFSNERLHEHYDDVDLAVGDNGEFNNDAGTSGFGDIVVTGKRIMLASTRHLLVGGLGLKLPTGEYQLKDSEGALNEPTIMPGTGSYDFIVSGHYVYQIDPHRISAYVSTQLRFNTENKYDYKFGDSIVLNTGLSYRATDKINISGQINARVADRDEYKGDDVPSTGSTMIFLTPGIQLLSTDSTSFYTHIQVPLYERVNEVNLVPTYGVEFGVSHQIL